MLLISAIIIDHIRDNHSKRHREEEIDEEALKSRQRRGVTNHTDPI